MTENGSTAKLSEADLDQFTGGTDHYIAGIRVEGFRCEV